MRWIRSLRAHASALHDNHKRIAAGAALIAILTIVSKICIAIREVAIAWRFGISPVVDAYQLSLTIATWLPTMLSGVMTVVLVPRLVLLKPRSHDYGAFIAELNGTVALTGIAVALLTFAAAPYAAAFLASGGDRAALGLTSAMAQRMVPIAAVMIVVGYLSARLQASERYTYSVSEAVPALVIGLLTILPLSLSGPALLVGATLVGFFLQFLLMAALAHSGDRGLGPMRFRHCSPVWRSLYGALLTMTLGQMLIMASLPIDQAFAARLGEGSVAVLGYATRVATLASGLAAIVLGRALLPVLARAVAAGDHRLARRQALTWSMLLLAAGAIAAAALWAAAPYLVRLLFERGAFSPAASALVTQSLRYGLLQLPPYFAGIALVQWFAATDRFRAIALITSAALLAKVTLNVILAPRLGVPGIMLSTAGMYAITAAFLALGSLRSLPGASAR